MDRLGNQCKEEKEIMINVSDQLLKESKENQDYYVTANVTLTDGTKLSLKKENFYLDGNGIVDSADSSSFPVGVAIEKTATLSLVNDEEQFLGYSFNRAVFAIYMNLELSDGKVETFKRGSFIVCKKPAIDEEINLTLLDYMSKTDRSYETNLTFPCTAGEVLQDSCQTCGITLGDATFKNSDFRVMKKPTGTTHRAVIGMVAALAGGNARIDENDLLRIVTYQAAPKVVKLVEAPWMDASGNNIYDIEENEIIITKEDITIGLKLEEGIDDVQTDIDIITVTGVKYTEDERDYIYGQEGYLIDLKENQLLSGNAEDGVNCIGRILTGFQILPFSVSSIPIGYATFGDAVQFEDYRGNIYRSYATDIEFLFADSTNFSCKAKSVESQGAEYPDENKVLIEQAKEDTRQKMTAYDIKLKQMNELAANTLGFYFTIENLTDGSTIVYRHDKPTLKESKIIYKNGIDGFFLSVDGGETWKSGFDSNGDAVLNILYAIGIQAEYINTRGLTAKDNDGNITFRINADTGEVEINGSSVYIGDKRVDKMLEDMNNTIASAKNMTLQLSNDMQTIASDADGNIPVFPTVATTASVMYGSQDVTNDCSYTITKSDSVTGSWDVDTHTYTVTGLSADNGWVDIKATYLQTLSITRRFTIAKLKAGKNGVNGLDGLQGEKGEQGVPGKDGKDGTNGVDGKTSYFHIKYSSVANPTSSSQMTKTPSTYIGTYVDYEPNDSTDPKKYTWSKFEGADGKDGIAGTNGTDGKTYYLHIAYANSADGKTGFSVSDGTNKLYIGQYTDTAKTDSTDPTKYTWSKIKGETGADGKPGRTYIIEPSCNVLKRGADKNVSPNFLKFNAYYRDGDSATRYAYKGRFVIEETTDGNTWKTIYTSSTDEDTVTHYLYTILTNSSSETISSSNGSTIGIPRDVTNVRCKLYASGGTTTLMDMQSVAVVIDVDNLTQEQIVKILSDDGKWNGLYYRNGKLYISFSSAMGGSLLLGGKNNSEGFLKILDKTNKAKALADYSGFTCFSNYSETNGVAEYDGIRFSETGIEPVSAKKNLPERPDNPTNPDGSVDIEYSDGSPWWSIDISKNSDGESIMSIYGAENITGAYGEFDSLNTDGGNQRAEAFSVKDVFYAKETITNTGEDVFYAKFEKELACRAGLRVYSLPTITSGWNCYIDQNNYKVSALSSSSKRYKILGASLPEEFIENLYNIEPIMARYKKGYLAKGDERVDAEFPMFIAEDVDKYFPLAVDHNTDGLPENWNERIMIPAMFAMIKAQKKKIDQQEKLINKLCEKLNIE